MSWKNSVLSSGTNHPLWKDGRSTYRQRLLKKSGKIAKCTNCGIKDVRLLEAHHKDRNRSNNALSNLEWLCKNCHYLVHLNDSDD